MKKILIFILAVCSLLAFNACSQTGHTHAFGTQWAVDSTSHWHACDCGEKGDYSEHSFGEWEVTKYPTATENGKQQRACSVCKYKETQTLEALGGNHTHKSASPATCTADEVCVDCGAVMAVKTGHNEVVDKQVEPTCVKTGLTEGKHCSKCGEVFLAQEKIPALGHIEVVDAYVAPTCDVDGKTEGKHCSRCNGIIVLQNAIPATGHTWGEGIVDGNATVYTCQICGGTKEDYVSDYKVVRGSAEPIRNGVASTSANTIALYEGGEFESGTISIKMKVGAEAGDNGLIFGLQNNSSVVSFWEGYGITYYFFFVSQYGMAYLGKTTNGSWTVCGEVPLPSYSLNKSYTLTVSRDKSNADYDLINCYIDGELYVAYKDAVARDGVQYGIRAGSPGVEFSDLKTDSSISSEGSSLEGYYIANGLFMNENGKAVSKVANSIAELENSEFVYGTLEVTVKNNGAADNGLIFDVTSNASHIYWENNVSYYFFFVNKDGVVLLGKVDDGTWTLCQESVYNGYDPNGTYNLKIEKDSTTIYGYVNGSSYIAFSDSAPLTGTGYGLRAGGAGVAFTNLSCNSITEITDTYATDLDVVSGKFTGVNGSVKSRINENVALIKNASMSEGTLTATIQTVSNSKAGLVFGYSNDENGEIYYRLVACKSTQSINVEKVVNGTFTTLFTNYASAAFKANKDFNYRVVINNGEAYCYFWRTLYYVVDLQSAGTGAGLYSENAGAVFSNYKVSSSAEYDTCDTLLFGHSYFEGWGNYASDLASIDSYDFGECLNIGIGGSQASHWKKFKESLVKYDAKLGIYMIGINDLTSGVSPSTVVNNIKETLLYIKSVNADFKAVVISVNHCPARTNIASKISEANNLMEALCNQYDWMTYAEIEYAYCDDGINPSSAWFTDGLHLTAAGYSLKLTPAIEQALIKFKEN